jgi:hypothetical protein
VVIGRLSGRFRARSARLETNGIRSQLNGQFGLLVVPVQRRIDDLRDQLAGQQATAAALALVEAIEESLDLAR